MNKRDLKTLRYMASRAIDYEESFIDSHMESAYPKAGVKPRKGSIKIIRSSERDIKRFQKLVEKLESEET